ncbi:phosphatidylinositol-specific phospholipase C domain-containing protein [Paenibacillus sp. SYP-B3998]|uniref:1-phosphatidylinositol phosphodiesterase n=1 Tax=Paenibacillus sp. SYP-B3998 TaxID=2678564 RepID=A0A6G4A7T3_9BACL|nr:phosphatidylinositol-specific phospholipase C domain-containing protein [Paenibacillus sp. SYP-B3998]NEW09881.1 phosphatidylinositol-specific phospholipase C domain-containing protein [Paenibacillus sp. SYP-B3998]
MTDKLNGNTNESQNENTITDEDILEAHPGYAYETDIGYQNKQWMSNLPVDVNMSQLSIPGTHGSMALYNATPAEDIAKNQTMSLTTQLNAGIRYVDMRVRRTKDAFAMHHGAVYQKAMFGDVLRDTINFLRQNPKETVFMRVKEEHDPEAGSLSFEAIFQKYWDNNTADFWDPNSVPTTERDNPKLLDIRGKIVVIQNFSASKKFGINYGSLNNQDQYNVANNLDGMYNKWTAVKNHLYAANGSNKSQIYLNHFSGTSGSYGGAYPWFVASGKMYKDTGSNSKLSDSYATGKYPDYPNTVTGKVLYSGTNILGTNLIQNGSVSHTGIIAADFPGKGLIDGVIRLNSRLYSGDVRYITPKGSTGFRVGFGGDTYLHQSYVVYRNGTYMGHVDSGSTYYGYWDKTDVGHDFRFEGLTLFTGDKIDVYVKKDGHSTLLKSQILTVDEQEGEEVRIPDGKYSITSALNNSSEVAMQTSLSNNGYNVVLWGHANRELNGQWNLVYDSNKKAYQIKSAWKIDEALTWTRDSINVYTSPAMGTHDEAYWILKRAGKGYLYLENKASKTVLDVTGGGTANGTNINVWGQTPGAMNQKFKLIPRTEKLEAQIDSLYRPQPGQSNRSSGNFSLEHLATGTRVQLWIEGAGASALNFKVMRDVSGGSDPTTWSNVKHGSIVTIPSGTVANKKNLYIANPGGYSANGTFKVKFQTLLN